MWRGRVSGEKAAGVHRNYCVNALVRECLSGAGAVIADIVGLRMFRRVRILRRGMGLWIYGSWDYGKDGRVVRNYCLSSFIILTGRSEPNSRLGHRVLRPVSMKPHFSITRPEAGFSGK